MIIRPRVWCFGAYAVLIAAGHLTPLAVDKWTIPPALRDELGALGQFGDLFSAVSALFSGLAFLTALLILYLQQRASSRTTELAAIAAFLHTVPAFIQDERDAIERAESCLVESGVGRWGSWSNRYKTMDGISYWKFRHSDWDRRLEEACKHAKPVAIVHCTEAVKNITVLLASAAQLEWLLEEQERHMTTFRRLLFRKTR